MTKKTERGHEGDVALEETTRLKKPRRFRVVLHNDDYTTMEFVVHILETVFRRSPSQATQIMLKVHSDGRGTAGVYPREVAETKVEQVHVNAEGRGFPLRASFEPE